MATKTPDISARPIPSLITGVQLYHYQNDTIEWMKSREKEQLKYNRGITGGLVCLKMGLGKTLTALQLSMSQQTINEERYPTLVVTSKTVMYEWKSQGVETF